MPVRLNTDEGGFGRRRTDGCVGRDELQQREQMGARIERGYPLRSITCSRQPQGTTVTDSDVSDSLAFPYVTKNL